MKHMISEHISEAEVACSCCGEVKYDQTLINVVEWLRSKLNKRYVNVKAIITSWNRCVKHDKEIGGKGNHPKGKSVDIYFTRINDISTGLRYRINFREILELLKEYPEPIEFAIGIYNNNRLHIEIGRIAKWDNRSNK